MGYYKIFLPVIIFTVILFGNIQNIASAHNKLEVPKNKTGLTPINYANKSNWMHFDTKKTHEVDLLYFYQTIVDDSSDGSGISEINNEHKKSAKLAYNRTGSVFSAYTNVYAPYYRQTTEKVANNVPNTKAYTKYIKNSQAKLDIFNALDYYFNNLNNGRPFIISGHSQGSVIMQLAFEEYFPKHPEYLNKMVATYIMGWPVTEKWIKKNHLKFATDEDDTEVIIAWYTEGPDAKGGVRSEKWISINPINWKLDETPATIEENKGSLFVDMKTGKTAMEKGFADATLNLKRGTVVCTTRKEYLPESLLFGNKSFHSYDYSFYYNNIKENGLKRIEKYLGHKIK